MVFFRTWTGITIFGFCNGFILLPLLMSEIGPLGLIEETTDEKEKGEKVMEMTDKRISPEKLIEGEVLQKEPEQKIEE